MKRLLFFVLFLLVLPTIAQGTTWYAGGGATTNCTTMQNSAAPSTTIAVAVACMAAAGGTGHTVVVMAGTYNEGNSVINVPSGTDFGSGANTIRANVAGTVTFSPDNPFNFYNGNFHHVIFDGFKWNVEIAFAGANPAHHIRFKNFSVTNYGAAQGFLLGGQGGNEFIDGTISGNSGTDQHHGIYMASADNLVERVSFSNITGYCLQIYLYGGGALSNNVLRYNTFSNCNTYQTKSDVTVYFGDNNQIYGNIFKNGPGGGLSVGTASTTNLKIYNNTFYNYPGACIHSDNSGSMSVINNICSQTGPMLNAGSGSFTTATNLCSGSGFGCTFQNEPPSTTFTDPVNGIFTLKQGSAAINSGTPLGSPYNVDIVNTTRPQPPGSNFDLGAYEAGGVTPSCPGVNPALVASYAFEDSSNDSTGIHTATLGSGWTYTAGKYGRGVTSTGASGITVADSNALDMCGGFTYMGWINLPNTSGDYAFIVKNPDAKSFLFGSITYTCGAGRPLAGYSQDPANAAACYGTALTTGSFQHMAVTYDSSLPSENVKLYINGSLATSADGTTLLDATTGTLQFCNSGYDERCPSGTIIDEIRIYNYARTAQQIVNDMNTAIQVGVPTELIISGGTRRIGPGTTLRYGLKK